MKRISIQKIFGTRCRLREVPCKTGRSNRKDIVAAYKAETAALLLFDRKTQTKKLTGGALL